MAYTDELSSEYLQEPSTKSAFEPSEENGCKRWIRRLLRKDNRRFMKYIRATSTHGIAHVFTGKSKTRRVFWALLLLAAISYCLYAIIIETLEFKSIPTSTTIYTEHAGSLEFPAVTLCNLNSYRRSYLERNNLTYLVKGAFGVTSMLEAATKYCSELVRGEFKREGEFSANLSIMDLQEQSKLSIEDFVVECNFLGMPCNLSRDFTAFHTQLGVCYIFNGQTPHVYGSGLVHSLQLVLNIEEQEYGQNLNSDTGARVVIQSSGVPPIPAAEGISVPPGHNAFIAIRQRDISDQSNTGRCRGSSNDVHMKLLQGYSYSLSACIQDCVFTEIAKNCKCLDGSAERPPSGPYSTLPVCQVRHLCCVVASLTSATECACDIACQYTKYELLTSYSSFPAPIKLEALANLYNTSADAIRSSFLGIHIYFEELIVYREVTRRVESTASLLSGIGGLVGLFIGGSVITLTEFVVWLLDELKDRCIGVSDRSVKESYDTISADLRQMLLEEGRVDLPTEMDGTRENMSIDSTVERSTAL